MMEKSIKQSVWKNYRNKWVFLNGKKVKLRQYIGYNAAVMKARNKPGWEGVDHYANYKVCLYHYGFMGVKIYEDYFFKGIPLPEDRNLKWRVVIRLVKFWEWLKRQF